MRMDIARTQNPRLARRDSRSGDVDFSVARSLCVRIDGRDRQLLAVERSRTRQSPELGALPVGAAARVRNVGSDELCAQRLRALMRRVHLEDMKVWCSDELVFVSDEE